MAGEQNTKLLKESMDVEYKRKESRFMSIKDHVAQHKLKYLGIMSAIGLINNMGYVMVGSGAQKISEKFGKEDFMSAFQLSLIVFSAFIRIANIKFFIKILHRYRIFAVIGISSLGYTIIAISCAATEDWGFYLSLVGSVFCGSMQALGEGVNLGFLKSFPSELVGGWSSGTGLAGVVGSLLFIALNSLGVNLTITFACLIPLQAIYLFGFLWYDKKKAKHAPNSAAVQAIEEERNDEEKDYNNIDQDENNFDNAQQQFNENIDTEEIEVELPAEDGDAQGNVDLNCESFQSVFPHIYFFAINIGLVYFFEYSIITGFANKITDRTSKQNPDSTNFFIKEGYEVLNFCYQFGVFCSRSSLSFLKVQKVWILTIFQFINFVAYFFFAFYDFMPMYGLIPIMLWVGFMGGASYVNVMYLVVNSDKMPKKKKELAVNVVSIFNDIGVLSASLFSMFAASYILKDR